MPENHTSWNLIKNPTHSVDLEKVLLLAMMEQSRRSNFTRCLVCFNEILAPLAFKGKGSTAVIWHEATSGREDESVASAFHKFIMTERDAAAITIWADN